MKKAAGNQFRRPFSLEVQQVLSRSGNQHDEMYSHEFTYASEAIEDELKTGDLKLRPNPQIIGG